MAGRLTFVGAFVALVLAVAPAACQPHAEPPAVAPALPAFEDFPPFREIAPEAIAPDLVSHPLAWRYRAAITEGAHRGAAFAGHLAVATWACGVGCQQYAFIDARDGRVIWGPETRYGAAYVQHSRLFVADPPGNLPRDAAGRPLDPDVRPEPYVWDGERLVPLGRPERRWRRAAGCAYMAQVSGSAVRERSDAAVRHAEAREIGP